MKYSNSYVFRIMLQSAYYIILQSLNCQRKRFLVFRTWSKRSQNWKSLTLKFVVSKIFFYSFGYTMDLQDHELQCQKFSIFRKFGPCSKRQKSLMLTVKGLKNCNTQSVTLFWRRTCIKSYNIFTMSL